MELEELKAAWNDLSLKVEKQEKLSNQIIEKMTQQQYRSRLNRIVYPETAGTVICFICAALLAWNFNRLEQPLMQLFCLLSVTYLVVLPVASLTALKGLKSIELSSLTYSEALKDYARKKIRFQKLQKFTVLTTFLFMIVSTPVMMNMMGKDISQVKYFWTAIVPGGLIFFFVFSIWVLKKYNKALIDAETLLSEIDK